MSRVATAALCALLPVLGSGCLEAPADDYQAFLDRADRSATDAAEAPASQFADLSGRWLLHAQLTGGIAIGLRIELEMGAGGPGQSDAGGMPMAARIWLDSMSFDDPPLVETTTTVALDGTFLLEARPLVLGTELLNTEDPVIAEVTMDSRTLDGDLWCGLARGAVTSPLQLDLKGSTFAARRDDGTLTRDDVPRACPDAPAPVPDAGGPAADGSADSGRPAPPDLSSVPSERHDLTGHWLLDARLGGAFPMKFWATFLYTGAPDVASLDGALRRETAEIGDPAVTTFSATVTDNGRFELWLPGFTQEVRDGVTVEADILLVGVTLGPDVVCGALAGRVFSPLVMDLDGSTFGGARWTPGEPPPDGLTARCPE